MNQQLFRVTVRNSWDEHHVIAKDFNDAAKKVYNKVEEERRLNSDFDQIIIDTVEFITSMDKIL